LGTYYDIAPPRNNPGFHAFAKTYEIPKHFLKTFEKRTVPSSVKGELSAGALRRLLLLGFHRPVLVAEEVSWLQEWTGLIATGQPRMQTEDRLWYRRGVCFIILSRAASARGLEVSSEVLLSPWLFAGPLDTGPLGRAPRGANIEAK
jgi:hypothetical protein